MVSSMASAASPSTARGTSTFPTSCNKRIEKFTASGGYLTQWATPDGAIDGVAVDHSGNVYAADYWNARILKFSASGTLLKTFPTTIAGDIVGSNPHGVAVDASGNMWVTDSGDLLVKEFSSSGSYLGNLGTTGHGSGQFSHPVGVAVDSANNVYVVDCDNYTIQKFSAAGKYLDGHTTICSWRRRSAVSGRSGGGRCGQYLRRRQLHSDSDQ